MGSRIINKGGFFVLNYHVVKEIKQNMRRKIKRRAGELCAFFFMRKKMTVIWLDDIMEKMAL